MAYSTGSSTGQADLIGKIATFIGTVSGWTIDYNGSAIDIGADTQLMFHNGDCYYTMVTRTTDATYNVMGVNAHTSINTGLAIGSQPGQPNGSNYGLWSIPKSGSIAYYLFGNSAFLYFVAQMGNWFQHLFMGQLSAIGGYSHRSLIASSVDWKSRSSETEYNNATLFSRQSPFGGSASSGSTVYGGYMLSDSGSWLTYKTGAPYAVTDALPTGYISEYGELNTYTFGMSWHWLRPCPFTWSPIMMPVYVSTPHPTLSGRRCIAGYFPGIYMTRMDNISVSYEFTVDTDTYIAFPIYNRVVTEWSGNSRNWGVAVKQI